MRGCERRVPFVYCFLIILYAMWLLIKYYQVLLSSRPHLALGCMLRVSSGM